MRGVQRHLRGLRVQIVLWTVVPLTLVLIGVAFTGVYGHERAMATLVEQRDQALAAAGAGQVRDLLREQVAALQALAAGPGADLKQAGDLDGRFAGPPALLDEQGRPLASGAEPPAWTGAGVVANLAQAVMIRQEASLSPVFYMPDGGTAVLLAVPVPAGLTGGAGGRAAVLAGPLAVARLAALLAPLPVGEHGAVYLLDGDGQVLIGLPQDQARASLEGHSGLATILADTGAGATLCRAPDGERMALAYAPVDYPPLPRSEGAGGAAWWVVIEEPWHQVISPVLRYSGLVPLVAALAVVVSLLTLYYGVRAIVRPLQVLGQRAERLAWGDFGAAAAPVGGVEEIEDLRRALDDMARRIQGYQRGMHDYIAAITRAQEDERRRLARELHDDTAQSLIALGQQLEMAHKLLHDPEQAAARLAEVRTLLAGTLDGVRRFSRDLRPIYLEDLGFVPALEALARDQSPVFAAQVTVTGEVRRLPPDLELAAYRIVQEALNNVCQHAQAAHAWVEVHFEDENVVLVVRDDGRGFQAPTRAEGLARAGHFGLMGIQERALLLGGSLVIRSAPGQGTEITVRLPYPQRRNTRR